MCSLTGLYGSVCLGEYSLNFLSSESFTGLWCTGHNLVRASLYVRLSWSPHMYVTFSTYTDENIIYVRDRTVVIVLM